MGILSEKKIAGLILLFSLIFVGFFMFLTEIQSLETLDDDSEDYIKNYVADINTYEIDTVTNQSVEESKETKIFIQDNSTGFFSNVDILGAYNFFNEQWGKISNAVYKIWSFPSFIASLSGLPMQEIRWIINLFAYILLIGFIYLVRKFISGN